MRALPLTLAEHIAAGVTTLCWCWRVVRRNGETLGFTDHDCDLTFDGTVFEAATGLSASEVRESVGLAVDNLEVESALSSDRISEQALAAGDFDDATVEIFRVDWSDPASRVLVRRGSLGEVERTGSAFSAEIRGLAHYLGQAKGRLFQYGCDADLGDARCGIDLADPAWRADGTVLASLTDRIFTSLDLAALPDGFLTRGLCTFTGGANAGRRREIKRHAFADGIATIELWEAPGGPIAAGDAVTVTAGCDKRPETCRVKFANIERFHGFPHMPGNDFLASPRKR
jgi:uncharacterized phage protein (TIGR02218 family)